MSTPVIDNNEDVLFVSERKRTIDSELSRNTKRKIDTLPSIPTTLGEWYRKPTTKVPSDEIAFKCPPPVIPFKFPEHNIPRKPDFHFIGAGVSIPVKVLYNTEDMCVVIGTTPKRGLITPENALCIPHDLMSATYHSKHGDVLSVRCRAIHYDVMKHPDVIQDAFGNGMLCPPIQRTYKMVQCLGISYPSAAVNVIPLGYTLNPSKYLEILRIVMARHPDLLPVLNAGVPCTLGFIYTVEQAMSLCKNLAQSQFN